ncbi:ATP-grasp domain-containing protein [Fructilactobacillus frigidiflavus]|uniref:carbamoyl phosphate synthase preATP-grasp domain-containing protein n=2 Tax=Fructilactobacillus frigidiflavus TaxID=3242688 RepID=UPI003757BEB8
MNNIKKILVIGGGSSNIGHEGEQDATAFQAMLVWSKLGIETLLIDDNPYSIMLSEIPDKDMFIKSITLENVEAIIKSQNIDAITPIYGQKNALRIIKRLNKKGILHDHNVKIIGLNSDNVNLFGGIKNNAEKMARNSSLANRLLENNIPILKTNVVSSFDELRNTIDDMVFPIAAKAIKASKYGRRHIFQNIEQLNNDIYDLFQQSKDNKVSLEREVGGYKEIGIVAIRDVDGTKMVISSLEDMNPVGLNSTDSVVFAPAQTLNDLQLHILRAITFRIMDCLGIKGVCHVQFALNANNNECFVIKVNPFFNAQTALVEKSTGYPLARVVASILLNIPITEIKLPPRFNKITPILQPVSDHVTVKMPIWAFDYLVHAKTNLGAQAKATGSSIGIGRNVESAFMNALRSSQSSPKDVLPSYGNLTEDELINELIHPTDIQILILFEAVNRGYSTSDLAELTKIDEFFFVIINNILKEIKEVKNNPLNPQVLLKGNKFGFGTGMFCHYWNTTNNMINQIAEENNIYKTYKMIEPTGGEFIEKIDSFYGSFECETDTKQLSNHSALVIGKGRNHLGPNIAADVYTAEMLIHLHKLGLKTIILNNNPNSVSLIPSISDKQYIEPVQLGDILDIVKLEKPKYIFVPGNRHYLIRELKKLHNTKVIVLPPDQKEGHWSSDRADFAIDFLVTKTNITPITTVGFSSQADNPNKNIEKQTDYFIPYENKTLDFKQLMNDAITEINLHELTGLIQVVFHFNENGLPTISGVSPLRITETIFLNLATKINWIAILMKMYTGSFKHEAVTTLLAKYNSNCQPMVMKINFPFNALGIVNGNKNRTLEIGAKISYK